MPAGEFGRRGIVRTSTRAPTAEKTPVAPSAPPALRRPGFFGRLPWCTGLFAAWLSFEFVRELRSATDMIGSAAPGHFTLLGAGATDRAMVLGQGEWWRLFIAPFLHGSASHIAGNLAVLLVAGPLLESAVGMGWFAAIYLAGGLGGSFFSLFADPPDVLSVGASGAIIAVLGAMFAASFHDDVRWPGFRRGLAGALLFPAFAPAVTQDGTIVDVNAHLGGALTGTAVILVMLASWREQDEVPSHGGIAAALGGLIVAITLFCFPLAQRNFDRYAAPGRELVPYNRMPKTADLAANSYQLAQDYPHDPRAQYLRGMALLQANDATAAEPYLRAALSLNEKNPAFRRSFSARIRAILALDLTMLHRRDEARNMAAPVCAGRDAQALAWVNRASLCTPDG
jgi:membrane associated rhomboid family serine protease